MLSILTLPFLPGISPICYKPEGPRFAKKIYQETLDEFLFANVREIISQL